MESDKYVERLRKCQKRDVDNESWNGNLVTMKQEIIKHGIENFIEYPTIVKTMARGNEVENEEYNFGHIKELNNNVELKYLNPNKFQQMIWDNIIEFGGGFGSLAKVIKTSNIDNNRYLIFDFEEFGILQQYYLERNSIKGVEHYHELQRLERQLKTLTGHNTFIGMWSLSEAPMDLRDKVMWLVRGFNSIFMAYNSKFDGIDNVEYFSNIRETFSEYEWTVWDASVEDSKYMFGRLK